MGGSETGTVMRNITRKTKLDLHGTRHRDVKREVISFIEKNFNDYNNDFEVVTGHSSIMKDIVISVLKEYKIAHVVGKYGYGDTVIIFWFY